MMTLQAKLTTIVLLSIVATVRSDSSVGQIDKATDLWNSVHDIWATECSWGSKINDPFQAARQYCDTYCIGLNYNKGYLQVQLNVAAAQNGQSSKSGYASSVCCSCDENNACVREPKFGACGQDWTGPVGTPNTVWCNASNKDCISYNKDFSIDLDKAFKLFGMGLFALTVFCFILPICILFLFIWCCCCRQPKVINVYQQPAAYQQLQQPQHVQQSGNIQYL